MDAEGGSPALVGWYEFNDRAYRQHSAGGRGGPEPNGIACPNCGAELMDSAPNVTLTSDPPRKAVDCPACGFASTRIA